MNHFDLSRLCDEHARRDAEQTRVIADAGPFRALLDRTTDLIWLNYAVPIGPIGTPASVAQALQQLRQIFAAHERTLRFEFNQLPWPELPGLLEQAGLSLHAEQPLMVCTSETFVPSGRPGVAVRLLGKDSPGDDLRAFLSIQNSGFEENPSPVTSEQIASLRERLEHVQTLRALATLDGQPAGVGSLSIIGSTAELAGIATHPNARRRGVATTLCSFLTRAHLSRGGQVAWLSAGNDEAQSVYGSIGFQVIDRRLNYLDNTAAALDSSKSSD